MKHVFIINPNAGKHDSRQRIYDMAEALREKHGQEVQCILTKNQGHATELARKLCQTGDDLRFYACGGDGTANEVANGVLGYDNAGIDARVAADVHKYSESPLLDGKASYIASLAVNFLFKGIGSHWTVELDGVAVEGDYSLVAVCNGRYYGGGFMPVAEARMDDGVLNTLVVKKVSRVTFAKFVGPYSRGEYAKFPAYAHCSTPKVIRIHSEKPDIVTCLDGECITGSDVTIRLCDKKLNFFGPEGCSCNATAR